MLTYSDLMTQVLIFFVMMFALASAMNEMQLIRLKKKLEAYVTEEQLENYIGLTINEKGLVVSLREKLMFDSGRAEIYEEAKNILKDITSEIVDVPNNTRIEGHTDNVPIGPELKSKFPTNWELSTARATNVTRYLLETLNFPPKRISSAGYGEYQPVADNDTEEHKAMNRRVDIVVQRIGTRLKRPEGVKKIF
ncbi:OmpA family protein [bacterium]|nr:OmpA family protein [bacterium]NIN91885.1 OmpA family protein [bacterium]NIO18151.1 OmpA family protein [bacterium]NIO73126.1 OmpA family protein [bacterium]